MNMAAMPVTIVRALKDAGYDAAHIQYTQGQGAPLGYELDREVELGGREGRVGAQFGALAAALDEGFDIFHFWNRSLLYRTDYGAFSGLDLPLIKARGRRIAYRFTGYDLRLPSRDLAVNPHSPFRYEQQPLYDETLVAAYQDYLREYVDRFFVQDPEMAQFFPEADIIPRALDLRRWQAVGVETTDRPLVVHAPTNAAAKGTRFVLAAVERLRDEGLKFDFRLLGGMPHAEARKVYEQADVIVDQLLSGATGVMTLEAWALGKPVVVNLRRDLFEPFYGMSDLPVANADPTTITDRLRAVIQDYDYRQDLGARGRALVEARHDMAKVIHDYIAAYEAMFAAPPKTPTGDGDLRYLAMQVRAAEAAEGFLGRWARGYRDAYRRRRAMIYDRRPTERMSLATRLGAMAAAAWPLLKRDCRWIMRKSGQAFRRGTDRRT